jgi:DNA processing protein
MTENEKYLVAISHFPKFGPVRLKKIRASFPELKEVFSASAAGLTRAGIEENVAAEFIRTRSLIDPEKIMERMAKEGIKICILGENGYPEILREIYDPPQILFYQGRLDGKMENAISIVGTRKNTSYGRRAAEALSRGLAKNSITIVSGLAAGIDTFAHEACLDAGGRTLAVLGSGLYAENIYPSSNRWLAKKIVETGGAIVSEFPPSMPALRQNFPQRNRIISGLSLGIIVVEAGEKSGALITAHFALNENREIFAVPGPIHSPVSTGPNRLIQDGARLITGPEDILNTFNFKKISSMAESKKILPETEEEGIIIDKLGNEPKHLNELVRLTGLDTSRINSTLAIMEIKGMVSNLGNMTYAVK